MGRVRMPTEQKKETVYVIFHLDWSHGEIIQIGATEAGGEREYFSIVMPDSNEISSVSSRFTGLDIGSNNTMKNKGSNVGFKSEKEGLKEFMTWLSSIKEDKLLVMISHTGSNILVLLNNLREQALDKEFLSIVDHFNNAIIGIKVNFPDAGENFKDLVQNVLQKPTTCIQTPSNPLNKAKLLREILLKLNGNPMDCSKLSCFEAKLLTETGRTANIIGRKGSTINGLKRRFPDVYFLLQEYGEQDYITNKRVFIVGGATVEKVVSGLAAVLRYENHGRSYETGIKLIAETDACSIVEKEVEHVTVCPELLKFSNEKVITVQGGTQTEVNVSLKKVLSLVKENVIRGGGSRLPFDEANL